MNFVIFGIMLFSPGDPVGMQDSRLTGIEAQLSVMAEPTSLYGPKYFEMAKYASRLGRTYVIHGYLNDGSRVFHMTCTPYTPTDPLDAVVSHAEHWLSLAQQPNPPPPSYAILRAPGY